jgi:hypothetical protein
MKRIVLGPSVLLAGLCLGQACGKTSGGPCMADEDCPSGSLCASFHVGDERTCHQECETEDDCAEEELCSWAEAGGPDLCHPPHPTCDPEATDADCECGQLTGALRVHGQGDACTVEARDVTVCAWYRDSCLDGGCTTEYFRYPYADDSGYIVRRSGPGKMSEGWQRDGSAMDGIEPVSSSSCPAADAEF